MSAFFPELSEAFRSLLDELSGQRVGIIGHARPDGDCIGSEIALAGLLREGGVVVNAVNADHSPSVLGFLFEGAIEIEPVAAILESDFPIIYVDCADQFRVGPITSRRLENREMLANFDHHISNTNFAKRNFVDPEAAATCEILAGMAYDLGLPLSKQVAQALYVGIMTDTGRFGYAATTSRVFEICARLVKDGASPSLAHTELYEREPLRRLKLLQRFLASVRLELDDKLCIGELRQSDFEETGATYEDTEGFVEYARSVRVAEVGAIIEERKSTTKCSLRTSNRAYRLDRIAAQFGGGGHACAAAANSDMPFEAFREKLLEALKKRFEEIE